MSPYFIIYAFIVYKIVIWLISWWVQRGAFNWKLRIQNFIAENDGNVVYSKGNSGGSSNNKQRLLFIVVPSSGAGKAMSIFDECIEELQTRTDENFIIEIYVTKSSDDVKSLLMEWKQRRRTNSSDDDSGEDDVSKYYGIMLLGGDSSITELIQNPLRENNDKWVYPPILPLPGGSTNLLSKEFHQGKSHKEIVRNFSLDKVKNGCLIKLSSTGTGTSTATPPVYATHCAIHGVGQHMMTSSESRRHSSYAVFGMPALLFSSFQIILNPPNKKESPNFSRVIASTTNFMGGQDSGFGNTLFDDQLVMIHVMEFKGSWNYMKTNIIDSGSGKLAKQHFESLSSSSSSSSSTSSSSTLPKEIEIQMGTKFQFDNHPFHFVLHGTTTVNFKGNSIIAKSLSIPYFVL